MYLLALGWMPLWQMLWRQHEKADLWPGDNDKNALMLPRRHSYKTYFPLSPTIEQHILDTIAEKQLSQAATDV